MDAKHTPGPWRWEYNASSKSVSIVGGATRYETVMDFARWGMGRAAPMFNEAVTDPQGWHIITRLPDRPDWVAPIPGREHHKDWCMTVIHPDAVLMARAPELLAETTRLRDALALALDALTCSSTGFESDDSHRCVHCDENVDRDGSVRAAIRKALGGGE